MVLEPGAASGIREALARAPRLDLGMHIVLTGGGAPASPAAGLSTLAPGGRFARNAEALPARLDREEVRREIEAQLSRFERLAGRPPSHLDSHHHSALHPDVEPVFAAAAREKGLPVRASSPVARERLRAAGLRTPDVVPGRLFRLRSDDGKSSGDARAAAGGNERAHVPPGLPR